MTKKWRACFCITIQDPTLQLYQPNNWLKYIGLHLITLPTVQTFHHVISIWLGLSEKHLCAIGWISARFFEDVMKKLSVRWENALRRTMWKNNYKMWFLLNCKTNFFLQKASYIWMTYLHLLSLARLWFSASPGQKRSRCSTVSSSFSLALRSQSFVNFLVFNSFLVYSFPFFPKDVWS